MGTYVNPDNADFQRSLNDEIYVDKSSLIALLNRKINARSRFICISRPRRFGKSVTAGMLGAYYSKGCDSSSLFASLNIAKDPSYTEHLNQHNVIFLNMQDFYSEAEKDVPAMLSHLDHSVIRQLQVNFSGIDLSSCTNLKQALQLIYDQSHGESFVFIIDEWDCIMRDKRHDEQAVEKYLDYLRLLLKDKQYAELAYMTGILPIKKYGTHSALNMFKEYSMTEAGAFAPYIGFTEEEVRALCNEYHSDFLSMKRWYDGYSFRQVPHIYNPNSVVSAITEDNFTSYWTQTETYEALQRYIDLNLDGLRDDIIRLIAGEDIVVDTSSFKNDMISCESKDEVLSLLIHLGYLSVKVNSPIRLKSTKEFVVKIPNEEIREEFRYVIKNNDNYPGVYALLDKTYELLDNIWSLNSDEVAKAFDAAHQDHTSILKYNDENSLACVVALSLLLSTTDTYDVHRELPAGKGFADMVYLPKQGVEKPALLVELKQNASAVTAIRQIKEKNYTNFFKDYKGEVLLVGINYSEATKEHQCMIERWERG